jgi:hypothetical protein
VVDVDVLLLQSLWDRVELFEFGHVVRQTVTKAIDN